MKTLVFLFVYGFLIYILIGIIVAFLIQASGLKKIDPSVEGAGIWFRVITFPGMVALWPILLNRWIKTSKN